MSTHSLRTAWILSESLAAIRVHVGIVEASQDDVLSPWPEAIGRPMAAQGGGAFGSKFDRARLPASYQRIAAFFQEHLVGTTGKH